MTSSRKTWVWIVAGSLGAVLAVLIALAGAGVYFVSHHIHSERLTSADALTAFEAAAAPFGTRRPLYELDSSEEPRLARPLGELPTAPRPAESLAILAWDPESERLVRVSLPFWTLRLGHMKMSLSSAEQRFDLARLHLDVDELGRIGPSLVFDFRGREGARVLLWTQ
jgi:hypothetical protein